MYLSPIASLLENVQLPGTVTAARGFFLHLPGFEGQAVICFLIQLGVLARKRDWQGESSSALEADSSCLRPFFDSLIEFMTSGPIVAMVLEGEDAIKDARKVMGATDPAKADAGTLRKQFASSIEKNIVHGSDGPDTAAFEIPYFFGSLDLQSR